MLKRRDETEGLHLLLQVQLSWGHWCECTIAKLKYTWLIVLRPFLWMPGLMIQGIFQIFFLFLSLILLNNSTLIYDGLAYAYVWPVWWWKKFLCSLLFWHILLFFGFLGLGKMSEVLDDMTCLIFNNYIIFILPEGHKQKMWLEKWNGHWTPW